MSNFKLNGKVVYQDLGLGFWGIIDDDGREWRPVKMPEQLKVKGKEVKLVAKEVDEEASIFMWGTAIKIISFET